MSVATEALPNAELLAMTGSAQVQSSTYADAMAFASRCTGRPLDAANPTLMASSLTGLDYALMLHAMFPTAGAVPLDRLCWLPMPLKSQLDENLRLFLDVATSLDLPVDYPHEQMTVEALQPLPLGKLRAHVTVLGWLFDLSKTYRVAEDFDAISLVSARLRATGILQYYDLSSRVAATVQISPEVSAAAAPSRSAPSTRGGPSRLASRTPLHHATSSKAPHRGLPVVKKVVLSEQLQRKAVLDESFAGLMKLIFAEPRRFSLEEARRLLEIPADASQSS